MIDANESAWSHHGVARVTSLDFREKLWPHTGCRSLAGAGDVPIRIDQRRLKITFSDATTLVVSEDHPVVVNTPSRRSRKQPWVEWSAIDLFYAGTHDRAGNRKWFVPLPAPLQFPHRDLPVDPYVLGYLLGNGGLSGSSPVVTIPDEEIRDRIAQSLPEGVFCKPTDSPINFRLTSDDTGECANALLDALDHLRLMGHTAEHKFIPETYVLGSIAQRGELLRGVMDADGCGSGNSLEFGSTSERLRDDVVRLARSLGGIGSLRAPEPQSYVNPRGERVQCLPRYRTTLALPEGVEPFWLARKASQYTGRSKYPPARSIDRIEQWEVGPAVDVGPCITGQFVVA